MITLICSLTFLGFYFLYHTSKRADLTHRFKIQKWIENHIKESKIIGVSTLLLSLFSSVFLMGFGTGLFSFLVMLMTLASLIILISPLRLFKSYFLIIPMLSLVIELFSV